MKTILVACISCALLTVPAQSELTQADLDKIRLLIHEEHKAIKAEIATVKAEIATVKNEVSWIRGRLEGMEKHFDRVEQQITHTTNLTYGLIVLIVAAVGIPQIILTWCSRSERTLERRMEAMAQELETLKKQRIVNP